MRDPDRGAVDGVAGTALAPRWLVKCHSLADGAKGAESHVRGFDAGLAAMLFSSPNLGT